MKTSLYLKEPHSKTETVIFARISYNGIQLKIYLPESIKPEFWDSEKQQARATNRFTDHAYFNQRLHLIMMMISQIFNEVKTESNAIPLKETLKKRIEAQIKSKEVDTNTEQDFFSFFNSIINHSERGVRINLKTKNAMSPNTIRTYRTTYKCMLEFEKHSRHKIYFNTIDLSFYADLLEYLQTIKKFRKNTVGKHIQILKVIMNEALDAGLHANRAFQSNKFAVPREDVDSIALSIEELDELRNIDLSLNKRLETVRDLFIVGAFTGLRFSDFNQIKPENIKDNLITIIQQKTKDKIVTPILNETREILDKYGDSMPKVISNQKMNLYLKEIGEKIPSLHEDFTVKSTIGNLVVFNTYKKYELLSTHTARRSFATNMYKLGKLNTQSIMAVTGHKTEKSFFKYIKVTPDEHARILQSAWNNDKTLNLRIITAG
jgi:integrase